MIYDVTSSPLLSPESRRLDVPELVALIGLAEDLLGLVDTAYEGASLERASRAVALQTNFLVAMGTDAFVFSMSVRGSRTAVYKGGDRGVILHPIAVAIVAKLAPAGENPGTGDWTPMTSRRRSA